VVVFFFFLIFFFFFFCGWGLGWGGVLAGQHRIIEFKLPTAGLQNGRTARDAVRHASLCRTDILGEFILLKRASYSLFSSFILALWLLALALPAMVDALNPLAHELLALLCEAGLPSQAGGDSATQASATARVHRM